MRSVTGLRSLFRLAGSWCILAAFAGNRMKNILVIDDDEGLCKLLADCLRLEGFNCACAHSGPAGLEKLHAAAWDLLVLDIMLPGCSGFEVLRFLRETGALERLPVLMLTAKSDEMDRIAGLEAGADDYLTKPFSPGELAARIRAILRRAALLAESHGADSPRPGLRAGGSVKAVGDLLLNSASLRVSLDNMILPITPVEFRIVEALLENCGLVVPRDELAQNALGHALRPFERSLDIHISRIRAKLGTHKDGSQRIRSVRGEGYIYLLPDKADKPGQPSGTGKP